MLRSFLLKLERNLMQSLELASIVFLDTHLLATIVFTCKHCKILLIQYLPAHFETHWELKSQILDP